MDVDVDVGVGVMGACVLVVFCVSVCRREGERGRESWVGRDVYSVCV